NSLSSILLSLLHFPIRLFLHFFSPSIPFSFPHREWSIDLPSASFPTLHGHWPNHRDRRSSSRTEDHSEEMSEATDIAILILIIGMLVVALYHMYNKTVKTETALDLALKLQDDLDRDAAAKEANDRDRVKEAKNVLRLLEKYDRKKRRKSMEDTSTEISTEDKKGKKKKRNPFGRVVLSVTEGGYKIPWVEGNGKLIELGPGLIKNMLAPSQATPHRCAPPEQRRREKVA
ncbi:hypothetical protein PRIPAC_70292, partial [Pristionchus pacificus]|uniref:Uncharacterized protein n=1 Tax=Pristionchus pacificus TaxID=54126 RepID=A0A2A6B4I5_PRIPA